MTSVPAPEPEASGADASALPPPEEVQVSAARPRLYALVDSAREGTVTVLVKRARGRVFRAALISLELLDPSARARLPTWPSWVRTEARGKLGDLISAAAGDGHSPGVPQVLLDRADTAPLAVLVDAVLVSPGNAPVVVPAGADNGDAPSVQVGDTARDGGQLPEPVGAPDARPSGNPGHSVASVADAESTADERPSRPRATEPAPSPAARPGARPLAALGGVLEQALASGRNETPQEALQFGLTALDAAVGGLLPGKLTLVAGAPGAGPSLLVGAAARHTAFTCRRSVLYAASGLTREDVAMRVIAAEGGVDYRRLRQKQLTDQEAQTAAEVAGKLQQLAGEVWHIDDGAGLRASDISDAARYVPGLALIVVDRLQRVPDPLVPLSGRDLPAAVQSLAHLARVLRVPVVAAVDTDEANLLAALDADVTLTVTKSGEQAEVSYAERDFGVLETVALHADFTCARFTDAPAHQPSKAAPANPRAPQAPAPPGTTAPGAPVDLSAEDKLLAAAQPFTSGMATGISARLKGALSALAHGRATESGPELEGLRQAVEDLAVRGPQVPETDEGHSLGAALGAYVSARRAATPQAPAAALRAAERELASAAAPLLAADATAPLSLAARSALTALAQALESGDQNALDRARARTAHLAGRRLQLDGSAEHAQLRTALTAFGTAAAIAGIKPVSAPVAPTTVTERADSAPAREPIAEDHASGDEDVSEAFQDGTVPPEDSGNVRRGRTYTFFTNKIESAVEQALQEADGDVDAAINLLKRKAVPDAMALFKLSRVGATYEHSVYPEPLEFLSKPSQHESDQIWEGRHKWRNRALLTAVKNGLQPPLDVTALDTNAAYLSAFKTYLPIGALRHHTRGFLAKESGIHRVDHFEWRHDDLPNPLGNRVEPGPYLLDEATVRLLIRCHELDLSEPPRILESWTSGGTEALLEKFRRILNEARTKAIQEDDKVTEEYVKAMYSRFTSTIGESGKNQELRRADWVHIIRSQAFASLWMKAHRAYQEGLTLVQVSGVDEIHVVGDWRQIWNEGRMPKEIKQKRLYTLGES
ncbi:Replicative DNA helicase (plasmid) [Streptomyces sp. YIM 121038]|uniref:DnaB-like helicase C-terminal domain-containing protein n=1 Tax=Streptomyces sp. YIM 121038 TaxID=2136401 RepID=UPI0011101723|nr:DnaB-like helicase C-terminal domain-containing protein [Streptomyces sp. YIM 121038]QCX82149.1 Replicative DNA helicase [Streptomyces sp. YIM 121038]